MINQFILNKLEAKVKPLYFKLKHWEHGWVHIQDVKKNSDLLSKIEKVDPFLCGVASYCHDLGRITEAEKDFIDTSLEGCRDHARLSILPTSNLLESFKITDPDFGYIVEAVTVHSYFNWSGKNDIAKILRDSDKLSAFGPLGLLRTVGFNIKNFVNVNNILSGYNSFERITSLASQTLISLNKDKELAQKYLNGDLKKILEWVDGKMFHSEKVYSIFADRIGYTLKVRDFLSKNSSNLFV